MTVRKLEGVVNEIKKIKRNHVNVYRHYSIKKKNGGERMICEPCDELKSMLRALIPFFKNFPVSRYATAYEDGCSIKSNALKHRRGKHILHLDIKEFFPSVNRDIFERVFCKHLDDNIAGSLWDAVSYNKGLPIGSPASPFICNRILYKADKKLAKLGLFIKYTRYADDLIFSSKRPIKNELIAKIEKILEAEGFRINHKKTYFMRRRKQVTGIIIHDKKLSVGTSYKKQLKSDIYNYLVKGEGYPDIIRGKFSHLRDIEPEYADIILRKYAGLDNKKFLRTLP